MQTRILIIGAGLGGLALAQGLVREGFSVTVFERDESPTSRPQGYRLSIRSLGMNALTALLTPEKMRHLSAAKVANVGDGFTCANEKMEPFFSVPQGQDAGVNFLRSELRTHLQEGVNIEWNKRLVLFEERDNQVVAHFKDGSVAYGDLLVGCDGAGSAVRDLLPSLYPHGLGAIPQVIPTHRVILGGEIDRTPVWERALPLNKIGMVRFLGLTSHYLGVCFSERADRSPTVFWAFSEEMDACKPAWYQSPQEGDRGAQIREHCKQLVDSEPWHAHLKNLVYATPPSAIFAPWFIRTTRFSESNHLPMVPSGRVTLLGDSAHAMPNDLALGGSHVLEDARLLSTLLSASPRPIDWPTLIGQFEREMFARAKIAVQESEEAAKSFQKLRSRYPR